MLDHPEKIDLHHIFAQQHRRRRGDADQFETIVNFTPLLASTNQSLREASPGDVVTLHMIFNGSEGPVRIHEQQQVVVAADGTLRIDLERVTTDYGACPS